MGDAPRTVDEFLDFLDVGEYDGRLKEIVERADARRNLVLSREGRKLNPGDKLTFNDQTSPKYLQGLTVEYVSTDTKRTAKRGNPWVFVRAPQDRAFRRFNGCKFSAPVNTLTKETL